MLFCALLEEQATRKGSQENQNERKKEGREGGRESDKEWTFSCDAREEDSQFAEITQ